MFIYILINNFEKNNLLNRVIMHRKTFDLFISQKFNY